MVVTNGEWNVKEGKVAELDTTVAVVLELSPLVDELAGELPAPLLWHDCREAGERLAAAVTQILHTVRYSVLLYSYNVQYIQYYM